MTEVTSPIATSAVSEQAISLKSRKMSSHHSTCRGITISVTAETNAGGRRHMEDYIAVNLAPSEESFNEVGYLREQAYVGVFDGHGGKEAAKCARERLWEIIQKQPKFRSSDLTCVTESIREGFVALHKEMEPQRGEAGPRSTWYF